MKKKLITTYLIVIAISLIGVAYAYFNYYKEINAGDIVSGDIYLEFEEGINSLTFTNALPETKEEARSRNNNTLTFTVKGKNTSNYDILYSIELNNGNSQNNKERFDPDDIVFDLVEINGNTRTMLLNAVNFTEFNKTKIWEEVVRKNTESEISHTYELRMWIDENVTYGDGENVDYTIDEFINGYASIKVAVEGDVTKKEYIKLEFDGNGGEVERLYKYVVIGEDYGELPNVKTRDGYTFLGWNGKNLIDISKMVNSNLVDNYDDTYTMWRNGPGRWTSETLDIALPLNTTIYYSWTIIDYNGTYSFPLQIQLAKLDDIRIYITNCKYNILYEDIKWIMIYQEPSMPDGTYTRFKNLQIEIGTIATPYEPYYVTNNTIVTEWNTNMVLKAIWEANS